MWGKQQNKDKQYYSAVLISELAALLFKNLNTN